MLSVCIVRMKQSRSATSAVWGNNSESQAPLWPYWENENGEPTSGIEL